MHSVGKVACLPQPQDARLAGVSCEIPLSLRREGRKLCRPSKQAAHEKIKYGVRNARELCKTTREKWRKKTDAEHCKNPATHLFAMSPVVAAAAAAAGVSIQGAVTPSTHPIPKPLSPLSRYLLEFRTGNPKR